MKRLTTLQPLAAGRWRSLLQHVLPSRARQPQLAFRTVFRLEGLHAASELASSGARNVLTHDTMQAIIDSAGREALADGLKDAAGGIVHDYVVTKAIENVSSGWTDMIVGVFENV